jgi:hypothetical protein
MKKAIIKKAIIAIRAAALVVLFAACFSASVMAAPQLFGRNSQKQDKTRLLTGKVLDGGDNPLPNAVVYLTNSQTRSVKTYIVGPDGAYRFPALQPSLDYEVYAQFNNRKSGTKTLSQFDDRSQVYISLKINTKAEAK